MRAHLTRLLIVTMAIVLAALALSCGSDTSAAPSPSTTNEPPVVTTTATAPTTTDPPPTTATTTEPLTDEEAILAAVDGFWQSHLDANAPPNPDHPDLARFRTGEALEVAIETARDRLTMGQAIRIPDNSVWAHYPTDLQLNDGSATLTDCLTDDSILYDRRSDRDLNDAIATTRFEMELLLNGSWKVDQNLVIDNRDGIQACDG